MLGLSRARHCLEIIARPLFLICRRSRRSLMTCRCKTARHAAVHGSAGENERQPRRSAVFATVRFLRLDSCENGSLCSSCKICEKYVGESELSMPKPQISEMTNVYIIQCYEPTIIVMCTRARWVGRVLWVYGS